MENVVLYIFYSPMFILFITADRSEVVSIHPDSSISVYSISLFRTAFLDNLVHEVGTLVS